jgi:hypothetical protein
MIRVLVLGVNPFEDLPGYQLLSLLKSSGRYEIIAADDSIPALKILSVTGTRIQLLPHPSADPCLFTACVARLCQEHDVSVLLPGTDAHLYALATCLATEPQLALLCPTLNWLGSNRLLNKWDLQAWASRFARTPPRWTFDAEEDASLFAAKAMYPLMVKGLRKGALKCEDELEAVVARRTILRNPANQGPGGGAYAESFVEGEEHSLFLLTDGSGESLATLGFRKLASTQLGTTLAAQIDGEVPSEMQVPLLLSEISGPTVLELEWRRDLAAGQWLFEVNVRFPSWIGALGAYGLNVLERYMGCIRRDLTDDIDPVAAPPDGSIFYRLPQSGFLTMEAAFAVNVSDSHHLGARSSYGSPIPMLWKSTSPHQFRLK